MGMVLKIAVSVIALGLVVCGLIWSSYFILTRNGFRDGNVLTDLIIDTGNFYRSRNANARLPGKLYPEMTDQEFGSRIVHSICASGAPCLELSQYRLDVWGRMPDFEGAGVAFGNNLNAPWKRAIMPGDRYVCHMSNPYWFSCLAGSSRRTEYRFIADGPYTPIQMWEENGAAGPR